MVHIKTLFKKKCWEWIREILYDPFANKTLSPGEIPTALSPETPLQVALAVAAALHGRVPSLTDL